MIKVLFTINKLTPYHLARIKSIQRDLNKKYLFEILELFNSSNIYKFKDKNKRILKNIYNLGLSPKGKTDKLDILGSLKLWRFLSINNPDILIISGWGGLQGFIQIIWKKVNNKKLVIITDSHHIGKTINPLKEFLKSIYLKNVDIFFTAGKTHGEYLNLLRINDSKIYYGCDVIDNDHFSRNKEINFLNNSIVTIARLSGEKNLINAAKCFHIFSEKYKNENWEWNIVGYGPLEKSLKKYKEKYGLKMNFLGNVEYDKLPDILSRSSLYWQPSYYDTWCLSINEACAVGLPLILSTQCGATKELCDDSNGWIFNPFSNYEIINALEEARLNKSKWFLLGRNSKKKIKNFSLESFSIKVNKIINDLKS